MHSLSWRRPPPDAPLRRGLCSAHRCWCPPLPRRLARLKPPPPSRAELQELCRPAGVRLRHPRLFGRTRELRTHGGSLLRRWRRNGRDPGSLALTIGRLSPRKLSSHSVNTPFGQKPRGLAAAADNPAWPRLFHGVAPKTALGCLARRHRGECPRWRQGTGRSPAGRKRAQELQRGGTSHDPCKRLHERLSKRCVARESPEPDYAGTQRRDKRGQRRTSQACHERSLTVHRGQHAALRVL